MHKHSLCLPPYSTWCVASFLVWEASQIEPKMCKGYDVNNYDYNIKKSYTEKQIVMELKNYYIKYSLFKYYEGTPHISHKQSKTHKYAKLKHS